MWIVLVAFFTAYNVLQNRESGVFVSFEMGVVEDGGGNAAGDRVTRAVRAARARKDSFP